MLKQYKTIINRCKYGGIIASVALAMFFVMFFVDHNSYKLFFQFNSNENHVLSRKVSLSIISVALFCPFMRISFKEIASLFKGVDKNLLFKAIVGPLIFVCPIPGVGILFASSSKIVYLISFIWGFICVFVAIIAGKCLVDRSNVENKKEYLKLSTAFVFYWTSVFVVTCFNGPLTMLLLFFLSSSNDVGAFFFGKTLGKRKLSVSSPNKTAEGLLCGVVFGSTLTFMIVWLLSVYKLYDIQATSAFHYLQLLMVLFCFSIMAHLGDLFFSKQKRKLNIKDYGKLLGPHGGFWDRFDSHAFVVFMMLGINVVYYVLI